MGTKPARKSIWSIIGFCLIAVAVVIVIQHFTYGRTDPDYNIGAQWHRITGKSIVPLNNTFNESKRVETFETIDMESHGTCQVPTPQGILIEDRVKLYSNVSCWIICNDGKNESRLLLQMTNEEGKAYAPRPIIDYGPDVKNCSIDCNGIFKGWTCNTGKE